MFNDEMKGGIKYLLSKDVDLFRCSRYSGHGLSPVNHGYESHSKLLGSYPPPCGMNSIYKYYGTAFVIFEFHSFDLQASAHYVSEAWVSLIY